MIPEFLRYILNRAPFYYPPNLPKEMLSSEVKTGQVDHKLWIAIEDIHDGWEKSGTVGQEVYGAGVAFGIVPRHFYRVPNEDFIVYLDYPTAGHRSRKDSLSFKVKGDKRLNCRMLIIRTGNGKLPAFKIPGKDGAKISGKTRKDGHIEYELSGNQQLRVCWKLTD